MNALTHQAITALDTMRLPELQARYLEVVGTPTRCPNRVFLVRKISDALSANDAEREAPAAASTEPTEPAAIEPPPATEVDTQPADEAAASSGPEPLAASPAKHPRGRFRGMTVEELQRKYVEIVGRPSGSENKAYLIWKIREAEKGHVPVGPVNGRSRAAEPVDMKVLPLRIESAKLARVDEAWRKHGLRNRTTFLRAAIEHYLAQLDAATRDTSNTE